MEVKKLSYIITVIQYQQLTKLMIIVNSLNDKVAIKGHKVNSTNK